MGLIAFVPLSMQEVLHIVFKGTYSNNCTPRQESRTRRQVDLEQD